MMKLIISFFLLLVGFNNIILAAEYYYNKKNESFCVILKNNSEAEISYPKYIYSAQYQLPLIAKLIHLLESNLNEEGEESLFDIQKALIAFQTDFVKYTKYTKPSNDQLLAIEKHQGIFREEMHDLANIIINGIVEKIDCTGMNQSQLEILKRLYLLKISDDLKKPIAKLKEEFPTIINSLVDYLSQPHQFQSLSLLELIISKKSMVVITDKPKKIKKILATIGYEEISFEDLLSALDQDEKEELLRLANP